MNWSAPSLSGFSAPKLPTLEEMKKGVPSLEEMKTKMSEGVQVVNSGMKDAAKQVEVAAQQVKQTDRQQLLSSVKGVFDLDALNVDGVFGDSMEYPEVDLTYITKRIAIMGFPENPKRDITVPAVALFLNKRHDSEYMIWNISEKQYDYSPFKGQVMDFKFPGYPAPPIGTIFKMCMSMDSWLNSDPKNVVIVHCMTGKGRSAVVVACLLEWIGKTPKAMDALRFVCEKRHATLRSGVVPTQVRYVRMFHTIMMGTRPEYEPLHLKQLTVVGIPDMFSNEDKALPELFPEGGCRPYLQVFKNGKLIFTSSWADKQREGGCEAHQAGRDRSFTFDIDCFIDGDIILRVRHIDTTSGKGVSMFRYGFHTGYVPKGVQTLTKRDLDSASVDPRFDKDMKVEILFESSKSTEESSSSAMNMFDATISTKSNFWDEISKKKELAKKVSETDKVGSPPKQQKPSTTKEASKTREFSLLDDDDEHEELSAAALSTKKKEDEKTSSELHDELDALNALSLDESMVVVDTPSSPSATKTTNNGERAEETIPPLETKKEGEQEVYGDKNVTASSSDDLDELAALEKELGLESLMDDIEVSTNDKTKELTGKPSSGDPDLAELENYLSGL
uniref:Phosphatidylinositol-3,4,5-trisphosphate 3-phosphatase n=1 Tax=Mucochytrium quahogii TaxID=96639 RepID=A0A7S2SHL3_9STRA|mmetsp:Transcript_16342/g.26624  ORF Transcript_16342/g.26624 Transcript_16342/m.26624 type:complete len:619 (+) Transcript_16342:51-1907(+)